MPTCDGCQKVSDELLQCQCYLVYYCNAGCQRQRWSVHKKECARARSATAAQQPQQPPPQRQQEPTAPVSFVGSTAKPKETPSCGHCGRASDTLMSCPCREALYCDPTCQRAQWAVHRKKCVYGRPAGNGPKRTVVGGGPGAAGDKWDFLDATRVPSVMVEEPQRRGLGKASSMRSKVETTGSITSLSIADEQADKDVDGASKQPRSSVARSSGTAATYKGAVRKWSLAETEPLDTDVTGDTGQSVEDDDEPSTPATERQDPSASVRSDREVKETSSALPQDALEMQDPGASGCSDREVKEASSALPPDALEMQDPSASGRSDRKVKETSSALPQDALEMQDPSVSGRSDRDIKEASSALPQDAVEMQDPSASGCSDREVKETSSALPQDALEMQDPSASGRSDREVKEASSALPQDAVEMQDPSALGCSDREGKETSSALPQDALEMQDASASGRSDRDVKEASSALPQDAVEMQDPSALGCSDREGKETSSALPQDALEMQDPSVSGRSDRDVKEASSALPQDAVEMQDPSSSGCSDRDVREASSSSQAQATTSRDAPQEPSVSERGGQQTVAEAKEACSSGARSRQLDTAIDASAIRRGDASATSGDEAKGGVPAEAAILDEAAGDQKVDLEQHPNGTSAPPQKHASEGNAVSRDVSKEEASEYSISRDTESNEDAANLGAAQPPAGAAAKKVEVSVDGAIGGYDSSSNQDTAGVQSDESLQLSVTIIPVPNAPDDEVSKADGRSSTTDILQPRDAAARRDTPTDTVEGVAVPSLKSGQALRPDDSDVREARGEVPTSNAPDAGASGARTGQSENDGSDTTDVHRARHSRDAAAVGADTAEGRPAGKEAECPKQPGVVEDKEEFATDEPSNSGPDSDQPVGKTAEEGEESAVDQPSNNGQDPNQPVGVSAKNGETCSQSSNNGQDPDQPVGKTAKEGEEAAIDQPSNNGQDQPVGVSAKDGETCSQSSNNGQDPNQPVGKTAEEGEEAATDQPSNNGQDPSQPAGKTAEQREEAVIDQTSDSGQDANQPARASAKNGEESTTDQPSNNGQNSNQPVGQTAEEREEAATDHSSDSGQDANQPARASAKDGEESTTDQPSNNGQKSNQPMDSAKDGEEFTTDQPSNSGQDPNPPTLPSPPADRTAESSSGPPEQADPSPGGQPSFDPPETRTGGVSSATEVGAAEPAEAEPAGGRLENSCVRAAPAAAAAEAEGPGRPPPPPGSTRSSMEEGGRRASAPEDRPAALADTGGNPNDPILSEPSRADPGVVTEEGESQVETNQPPAGAAGSSTGAAARRDSVSKQTVGDLPGSNTGKGQDHPTPRDDEQIRAATAEDTDSAQPAPGTENGEESCTRSLPRPSKAESGSGKGGANPAQPLAGVAEDESAARRSLSSVLLRSLSDLAWACLAQAAEVEERRGRSALHAKHQNALYLLDVRHKREFIKIYTQAIKALRQDGGGGDSAIAV
ncbi:hypothetical protein DIPPA_01465 [Diplonema papillatum]|nr:hypothetical protein DIPPA_01465 [Diplonema papillatum]